MTPVQASNPKNLYQTYMNLYGDIVHDNSPRPKPKFKVGDKIRITVKKDVFRKGTYRDGQRNYSLCLPSSTLIQ
jgi:hypothetical protein